jgi:phage tail sheath protein FI
VGNVGNVDNVTWQELKSLIETACAATSLGCLVTLAATNGLTITSNTTGVASSIQVTGTAQTKLGFDGAVHSGSATSSVSTLRIKGKWDGTYSHDLRAVVAAATNGETDYFNLNVTDDAGIVLEQHPNLQIATLTAADYVETKVNSDPAQGGSRYIEAEDLLVALRPANGTSTPVGGDDGLAGLTDTDFIGDEAGATGLHAFDTETALTILIDGGRATAAWQNGLIEYCEVTRECRCFALLDPPAGLTYNQIVTWKTTTAALLSDIAAICWPRYKVLNPSEDAYVSDSKGLITVAPSGAWAGVVSRNDAHREGGIYTQPAGYDQRSNNGIIYGAQELETDSVTDIRVRKIVFPQGINPISQEEGTPIFIDGEYVLNRQATWDVIGQARGVIFIETSIKEGLAWARHKNINDELFRRVQRSVRLFLKQQMNVGAFASNVESQAFTMQCDEKNNPASTRLLKRLYVDVGVAMVNPAIFVTLRIAQFLGALENELE